MSIDLDQAEVAFAASTDATVGIEEEYAVLDAATLELVPRFEELRDAGQEDEILRTQGQHNIALVGAGRLGQAIAGSSIFGEHGITIAAVFDVDEAKIGKPIGSVEVSDYAGLKDAIRDKNIVVGVLAVPTTAAQPLADALVAAGVRIIFNYSDALVDVPPEVTVHTSSPAVDLLHALYFYLS